MTKFVVYHNGSQFYIATKKNEQKLIDEAEFGEEFYNYKVEEVEDTFLHIEVNTIRKVIIK